MKYIGIDISKDSFHIAFNDEKVQVFANTLEGIKSFEDILHQRHYEKQTTKIGLESTGIYHLLLSVVISELGWQVYVLNPYIVSKAIKATLRGVKNDKKDALMIRKVLMTGEGYLFTDTPEILKLKALMREYGALVKMRSSLKKTKEIQNKYQETTKNNFDSCVPKMIDIIESEIKEIVKRMQKTDIETQKLLKSIPGIGPICSAALVAFVGNAHRFSNSKKLVAYIGLDCRVRESGTSIKGKGFLTKRGNPTLRSLLFNAAYVARQHIPELKQFYEKKRKEGKHYFVAMCAVERKLVQLIYAVWKRGVPYEKRV